MHGMGAWHGGPLPPVALQLTTWEPRPTRDSCLLGIMIGCQGRSIHSQGEAFVGALPFWAMPLRTFLYPSSSENRVGVREDPRAVIQRSLPGVSRDLSF